MHSSWTRTAMGAALAACLTASCAAPPEDPGVAEGALDAPGNDTLYIGDFITAGTNSVEAFAVPSGAFLGQFVTSGSGGLHGPTGLVFARTSPRRRGDLLVANQNVGLPVNGELLLYDGKTGAFEDALVDSMDPGAPFAPQGLVVGRDGIVYVADSGFLSVGTPGGRLARYDLATGAFLGDLSTAGFEDVFHPRAVVFGPDGLLYVTNIPATGPVGSLVTGQVLRFDPETGAFVDVFIDSETCGCGLARPQGLVFGPDGRLYVASFRRDTSDTDKILIFNGTTGTFLDQIELGTPTERAFAQALVFGPGHFLYVPITGGAETVAGEVRRYNIHTGTYDVIVPPTSQGGPLGQPVFLTFCNTDPATLEYDPRLSGVRCQRPDP